MAKLIGQTVIHPLANKAGVVRISQAGFLRYFELNKIARIERYMGARVVAAVECKVAVIFAPNHSFVL